jgi:glycosyltransferase involved in cell wall biosynthesis
MCEALVSLGHDITLCINRSTPLKDGLREIIERYYGVTLGDLRLISFYSRWWPITLNLRIAVHALYKYILLYLKKRPLDLIISRNLYGAYLLRRLARGKLIFETHQLETGLRRYMQRKIIQTFDVTTVAISKELRRVFVEHYKVEPHKVIVLSDAAPAGIHRLSQEQRCAMRLALLTGVDLKYYSLMVGYFGHLYNGRGIKIVRVLAQRHPDIAFFVYGGDEEQIALLKRQNKFSNLKVMGHIDPGQVLKIMGIMDVLLMPYQETVSIGGKRNEDTVRWMSPMKMFEYMAVGVPIIASKLPVLEEVLKDRDNCLMAEPDNLAQWSLCIDQLCNNPELAEKISAKAHLQYRKEYNWLSRAKAILNCVSL